MTPLKQNGFWEIDAKVLNVLVCSQAIVLKKENTKRLLNSFYWQEKKKKHFYLRKAMMKSRHMQKGKYYIYKLYLRLKD